MPSAYVKSLSKETGKSVSEIEKLWDKAKEIASDTFNKGEDDFDDREYKFSVGVVKNMLGLDERVLDPTNFLNSEKSAKEYIETLTSANFSIGNVVSAERNPVEDDEDLMDSLSTSEDGIVREKEDPEKDDEEDSRLLYDGSDEENFEIDEEFAEILDTITKVED